jgi:phosphoglucomutase
MERYQTDPARLNEDTQAVLAPVIEAAEALAQVKARTGRNAPDVIT